MATFHASIPNHFSLPRRISRLGDLAYNLWWTWNPDSQRLFSRMDKELWERVHHNPVKFLRQVERSRLNASTNNRYYLEFYDRIIRAFDLYMAAEQTWFNQNHEEMQGHQIAYFSMEFGLHEIPANLCGWVWVCSPAITKGGQRFGSTVCGDWFLL